VRERSVFSFRIEYRDRTFGFHLGRNGVMAAVGGLSLLFVLATHFLYDYRENLSKTRELRALRQRISEQNITLYNLHSKFESLETEVDRLRSLDARVKTLVRLTEPALTGGKRKSTDSGVGGVETLSSEAAGRLDKLLDLRFEQLKKDVLVDVKDLESVCDKLDSRRVVLASIPALWPVRGILSSGFGVRLSPFTGTKVFHNGMDILAPRGAPVKAAAGGKVVRSAHESLFGNIVVVDHGYGYRSFYAHLADRKVAPGDIIGKGDILGTVGQTGRTTGPHLHYEVHVNGLAVNPARFLD
jgi:murein DD-endopeptidase MepM/ murein hydrolase activator NlpD